MANPADAVSPAHAGIDPGDKGVKESLVGFPRPRGDRPRDMMRQRYAETFPPPTRG